MMPREPRANPLLIGHAAAEASLMDAMRGGRVHHAWLITGPPGIGKATLAFRFARRLLAGPGASLALPENDPVFRRVAAGTHADLKTIEREWDPKRKKFRTQLVVEHVRELIGFFHHTAAEGGWRVAVVDGAEDLNRAAENALLKILEEPPPRCALLLVTSAPGRIQPTTRSRCRRLALGPVPDAALAELLARWLPEQPPARRDRLVALAEGSPGRALQLAEGDGVGWADLVRDVLVSASQMDAARAHKVADVLSRDEDGFTTFMDLLRAGIASAVRDAARGRADADQMSLLGARSLDSWVDVWHALSRLQDDTEGAFMDKRQALVTGLVMLSAR